MDSSMLTFVYIFAWIVSMLAAAYIFAVFFGVKKQLWLQQKQLDITIAMASKAGVRGAELDEIINRPVK